MSTQQAAYVLVRRDGVIAVIADSDVILVAEHWQGRQVVAALVTHRLAALATVMLQKHKQQQIFTKYVHLGLTKVITISTG